MIDRVKDDGSQLESLVTGMNLAPASVQTGVPFTATIMGTNLTAKTYFDVRFRRPDSTAEEISLNWQQGTSATHTAPIGTATGSWTITGVRPHQIVDDQSGSFVSVSATLTVSAVPR